ncbi:protein kinase [Fimicolochytrium jonesii]|uniref:protein kinase n=1 Tax=Fimicolochytrium jonesii TaxID=1396493 RepID=UPI0022FE3B92|nr:protein kinase [Fimicolochytrium jonesii]KAI8818987.1 protein kinase [Fimicolochytrium jonesii]
MTQASHLRSLNLTNQSLTVFPSDAISQATGINLLNLSNNRLSSLPAEVLTKMVNLTILFCSDNRFTTLPECLGQLPKLEMVAFKHNAISSVPASAIPVDTLRWLILTDNHITSLPDEIGACTKLQKLMLAGNKLTHIPDSMRGCKALELVRISANMLVEFPTVLLTLPRLAWLAFEGNPFCDTRDKEGIAPVEVPVVDWETVDVEAMLGEGASGVIYKGTWRTEADKMRPVAVKVFKGEVTSDGWPQSELSTALHAGNHPNLIPILGHLPASTSTFTFTPSPIPSKPILNAATPSPISAPKNTALLMSLIPPTYKILAGPPSFATCTRDVYTPTTTFTPTTALRLLLGVASAVRHLHARGITHGDCYAHNVLVGEDGECYLGDFGGASFVGGFPVRIGGRLRRVEVRAFGCLVEEITERCVGGDGEGDVERVLEGLRKLRKRCDDENVDDRPEFEEICTVLRDWRDWFE